MSRPPANGRSASRSAHRAPAAPGWTGLRSSVIERLSDPTTRVAVVTAPAGYGKTSHLAAWVAAEQRPNAWIDLDESHNDINWILAALSGALGEVTDLSDDEFRRLTAAGATPAQVTTRVAPEFGRALAQCDVPFVLVLDGLEVISDLSSLDLLDALVCNVPGGSTVALAGRRVALRSLPRLRADHRLVEFSIDDLKLGPVEARMVVDEMRIDLGDDRVERLTAAAEGWPIAIRLGALAMQAGEAGTDVPVEFDGRDHLISDYLSSEWLRGLSLAERDVLMRSSVLEEMSGAVCDHVLGRRDSGAVLLRIHGERLLVIPLDRRNESYRMHSLLREALLAEFERADSVGLREAHRKASEWFLTTGDVDRAVRHRLAAGDLEAVEQLIAAHAPAWFTSGRYATVKRWLEAVPTEHMVQNPSLCLAAAMTSLGLGDEATTATWLRFAESAVGQESAAVPATVRLQVLAFRSLMNTGPIVPALNDARRAYQGLPPGIWHAASCIAYAVALWAHGDEGAEGILVEGAQEAAVWHAPSLEANCRAMLAMFARAAGDHRRARQLATEARRLLIDHGLEQAPTPVSVIAMCALVAAEDGDPKKAREDLLLARRNLTYFEETAGWTNVQSRLMLVHAGLALGDFVTVRILLNELGRWRESQPDALRVHAEVDEVQARVREVRVSALSGPSSLTTAELRVLHYLPSNLSLAEISSRLFISRFTTKSHCSSIYRKLNVKSRGEAVQLARRVGLLPASDNDPA